MIYHNPLAAEDQVLMFLDGWIALVRAHPYRVDWHTPNGRWIRGTSLSADSIQVDRREKCFHWARWLGTRPCDPSAFPDWPKVLPPFLPGGYPEWTAAVFATADGSVAIRRSPSSESRYTRYDVVDRRGDLVTTVMLDTNQSIIGFGDASVYVTTRDEYDLLTLTRHPWP